MVRKVWLLKDPVREQRLFNSRAIIAGIFSITLTGILLGRMYYLQIVQNEYYATLSTNNRVTLLPIAPTRGLIFDRNGVILAENLPTYTLEIVREHVEDLDRTLDELGKLIQIEDDDKKRFLKAIRNKRRFDAVPLRFKLTDEEVALVSVNRHRLPGVEINSRLIRSYPFSDLTSHTLGYVGRINEAELNQIDASNYAATSHIGKLGVEKALEGQLHGKVGFQQVETNARGRILRVLEQSPPTPGKNVYLNIDINLQHIATKAFGKERGALVAIKPNNGEVLSLVSVPSYDNNLFVNGISSINYRTLTSSSDKPLFNRAIRGQYPPGSTTKPFLGLAGLEYKKVTEKDKIVCEGFFQLENDDHKYRDWKKQGHGSLTLTDAIVESCDVFFYDLSLKLGIDTISDFMNQFGFGIKTGLDIGGERSGLMPTRQWKRRVRREPWFPGETLITAIGQGFSLATPLQLAQATATLANRGQRFKPQIINAIEDPQTKVTHKITPEQFDRKISLNNANLNRIQHAMEMVVHGVKGTARRISEGIDYHIAGKTGTAQVFGIAQDEEYVAEDIEKRLRDHALFIAFAPVEKPEIAVALIVENGGSGGAVAAPIAAEVIDAYLKTLPREQK